jgi:hypothetical protein
MGLSEENERCRSPIVYSAVSLPSSVEYYEKAPPKLLLLIKALRPLRFGKFTPTDKRG